MTTKFDKSPEGYLKGRAVITSTGIFEYMNSDGVVAKELRLPEEVFKSEFLDSLKMMPVTLKHPSFTVDATNVKQVQIGTTGTNPSDPRDNTSDNHFLSIDFVIHDAEAIKMIEGGTRALSIGYSCDLEKADPNARWCGQTYDYIQRNLKANHLSVVDEGRQGDQAKIRFDAKDMAILQDNIEQEDTQMASPTDMTVKIDASEIQEVIKTANEKADSIQAKLDALTADKSKVEAERDTMKDKIDALEKKVADLESTKIDEAVIASAVARRVKVLGAAKKAGVEVADGMDELTIQKAVIGKVFPKANLDGKDQNYIDARFDGAMETLDDEAKADSKTREAGADETAKVDSDDSKVIVSASKARDKMYETIRTKYSGSKGDK
jgi:hypothetical protein